MPYSRMPTRGPLTALAGGGQAGATALKEGHINYVGTVASAADSVLLPKAVRGAYLVVMNTGANSMNVFPGSGQTVNALAADAAYAVAAAKVVTFFCPTAANWRTQLTA